MFVIGEFWKDGSFHILLSWDEEHPVELCKSPARMTRIPGGNQPILDFDSMFRILSDSL
jgi:hypothetical protein